MYCVYVVYIELPSGQGVLDRFKLPTYREFGGPCKHKDEGMNQLLRRKSFWNFWSFWALPMMSLGGGYKVARLCLYPRSLGRGYNESVILGPSEPVTGFEKAFKRAEEP